MIGLLLTGGGARAAYQVGVLVAIAHALRKRGEGQDLSGHPFKILCGTSAGALNIATLASHPEGFLSAVLHLERIWSSFRAEQVFVADNIGLASSTGKWLSALTLGWLSGHTPKALLDTSPLRRLLSRELDLSQIDRHLEARDLHAVAVTASSYSSGEHLTFYSAPKALEPWQRAKRKAIRSLMTIEHLLASSAIPVLFPPVALQVEGQTQWFGDGAMRQVAPISPAIHLGAKAILAIGTRSTEQDVATAEHATQTQTQPSLAQIGGHALAGLFLDSLSSDAEQLARTNEVIRLLDPQARTKSGLREVALLQINPSEALEPIALSFRLHLPWMLRKLFGRVGATEARGAVLLSYLLFEQGFTNALIELGKRDAHAMMDTILAFIDRHS
ncbi:MAG: patatin-like phospholipase family protein [Betaproteobacteria bacterium]|nr:patatin-like phospholipase family protein [Betaproteobacteria bacterium]